MTERITKNQALRAARAKLPILGEKKLQEQLEHAVGSFAEAYLAGADAAQNVIVARIEAIKNRPSLAERRAAHGLGKPTNEERRDNLERNLDETEPRR